MSFAEAAQLYFDGHERKWTDRKHAAQFMNTLATYAFPKIGHLSVKEIDTGLVLKVVEPISKAKTATALPFMHRVPIPALVWDWSLSEQAQRAYLPCM